MRASKPLIERGDVPREEPDSRRALAVMVTVMDDVAPGSVHVVRVHPELIIRHTLYARKNVIT